MNIEDLISQYIDGELSSEAEAELHHRLSVSPEDRTLFREHVALRDAARSRQLQHQPSRAMEMALFARLAAEADADVPEPVTERAVEHAPEPAAPLRPLEPIAAAPAVRSMAADAAPVRSDRASTPREKRRKLIPMLVPFVIGVVAMGILWRLTLDSPDDMGQTMADNRGGSTTASPAPPTAGSEPTIVDNGGGTVADPEKSISSPLSEVGPMTDQGSGSYTNSEPEYTRRKSGSGNSRGYRTSSDEVSVSASGSGEGGGVGMAMPQSREDIAAIPPPPPPPSAPVEVQGSTTRDLSPNSYRGNQRGGPVPQRETLAEAEEVEMSRADDGRVQNSAPTPIEPPRPIQTQSDAKEKLLAQDTENQEPRQYASEPQDRRAAPPQAMGKPVGKPPVATPPPTGTLTQLGDAYFDPDKATLKGNSRQSLDYLVDLMKSYPDMRIEIEGHTDSDGAEDRNYTLSESRARAVMNYLRGRGIASGRMEIQGYGPMSPLAPNTTAAGKKLNRRVVVKVKDYNYPNSQQTIETNTK